MAFAWTLLIFIGCFTPAHEIPKVDVPFIDKWTHLVLFGIFSFLWLCAYPVITVKRGLVLFLITTVLGSFIELMQGALSFLGRSMELMDAIADAVGGAIGVAAFYLGTLFAKKAT